jgi:protease-4
VAILDLSHGLPEQPATNVLGLPGRGATFEEFGRELDRIGSDKEVRGLLVRLGGSSIGLSRAAEVGAMLQALGEKMPVYCHADDLGNATLYLASVGCKRIWLSPAGGVDAIGIAAQTIYFHKLLADELGFDVDFLQVGKYKGAEEPFTRDGPSPEARASLESTLGDIRSVWLEAMRKARPAVPDGAAEDGPYSAQAAKDRGMIDDVGYFDEARDAVKKASGAVRVEVRLGAGAGSDGSDLGDLLRVLAGESLGAAPIALVRATGAITMEGGGGLGGGGGIVERRLVRTLSRLAKDDDVKAVVLRIDSPGGSALASDLLWHALMQIRAKKPLVVSIGGMAASGGYYMASAGAAVFADEASIVGSIGVVGGKIAVDRALAKIGVHAETIPAKAGDQRAATRAGVESLLTPWDDATRARLLETMNRIYRLFLERVAEGRKLNIDQVEASAQGRIFAGREGKARGLVDEIGGLKEALDRARSMAGLAADARFSVEGEPSGLFDALGDDTPQSDARSDAQSDDWVARAWAIGAASFVAPFAESLSPLLGGPRLGESREHVLCALPFALTVK